MLNYNFIMLLDQIATLLTQLIAFYIPISDVSVKITCSVAITAIIYAVLKFGWDKIEKFFKSKISYADNYVIIDKHSKLYTDFIKYIYEKYSHETKGCKINNSDGAFQMLIEELNNGDLYDEYNGNKFNVTFEKNESNYSENSDKEEGKKNLSDKNIVIKTKQSMKVLDEYIKYIIRDINTNSNLDINMYKLKAHGSKKKERVIEWKKNKFITNKTIKNTIVTEEVQKLYYDDITKFINNKDYYYKKGIPYKRGYLLHGEPGCGKTSLIKAVARDLNLPLFMVDLSILHDNNELITAINELNYHINNNEPYLLIFEDLDRTSIFGKTSQYGDEYEAKSKITQDCLLNVLDGVDEGQGRIVIITTNELAKIKKFKSLIRPGRIDVMVNVTYCTTDQLTRIIRFYFDNEELDVKKINKNVVITPAQLLQVLYLLNDVDKTTILLNKFIDFVNIDIEKEIFKIKFDELKAEQLKKDKETGIAGETNDDEDSDDFTGSKSRKSKSKSSKRRVVHSRSKRFNRREMRESRAITRLENEIKKNKESVELFESTLDNTNNMRRLELEGKKIRVQMMELRKDNLMKTSMTPNKISKKRGGKKSDLNENGDLDSVVVGVDDIIKDDIKDDIIKDDIIKNDIIKDDIVIDNDIITNIISETINEIVNESNESNESNEIVSEPLSQSSPDNESSDNVNETVNDNDILDEPINDEVLEAIDSNGIVVY